MIKLYGYGPAFGLPDPSPFVVKAEVLLKMAGVAYEMVRGDPRKAPKGKIPWIADDGRIVPDTSFIRFHLEDTRGVDFDKGLSAEQKGAAWAIEKMLEDHLYWLVVHDRWCDRENFDKGARHYFDSAPAPLRPIVIAMVGRQVRKTLHAQGLGRHSDAEREQLGRRAVDALAACLGDKPWLMGAEPCGADATAFAFVSSGLCPLFRSKIRDNMERHANLVAYSRRGMARWFPELAAKA